MGPEESMRIQSNLASTIAMAFDECIENPSTREYTRRSIEEVTGRSYEAIHMIGGGTKDRLLCQMTADACRCEVVAGPIEATAMGNIAVQLIALGELKDLKEARRVIADSEPLKHYAPESPEVYDEAYGRFEKLL